MNQRAKKILDAGVAADPKGDHALLKAIAVMLAEATKKPAKKVKDKPMLPFSPAGIFEACGVEAVLPSYYGRVGGVAKSLGMVESDLDALDHYVTTNVRPWYESKGIVISADTVCKKLGAWLSAARESGYTGNSIASDVLKGFR